MIGGLRVYGPWRMDRHVIVISLIGGTRLDLSQAELAAPEVTLTNASLAGVRAENLVRGSDQRACSLGRPAMMITHHVPAVRVSPDRGSRRVASAVPA